MPPDQFDTDIRYAGQRFIGHKVRKTYDNCVNSGQSQGRYITLLLIQHTGSGACTATVAGIYYKRNGIDRHKGITHIKIFGTDNEILITVTCSCTRLNTHTACSHIRIRCIIYILKHMTTLPPPVQRTERMEQCTVACTQQKQRQQNATRP